MELDEQTRQLEIFVDVDGTLVDHYGNPNVRLISKLKELHAQGNYLTCWSWGGKNYAKRVVAKLGICEIFKRILSKPNVIIDDEETFDFIMIKPEDIK